MNNEPINFDGVPRGASTGKVLGRVVFGSDVLLARLIPQEHPMLDLGFCAWVHARGGKKVPFAFEGRQNLYVFNQATREGGT